MARRRSPAVEWHTPALRAFRSGGEHILVTGKPSRSEAVALAHAVRLTKALRRSGFACSFAQAGVLTHANRGFAEHGTFRMVTPEGRLLEVPPPPLRVVREGKW